MDYSLFIFLTPAEFAARKAPETKDAITASFIPYMKALYEAGIVLSAHNLHEPDYATTVWLGQAERQVQDGPYAETKEQLGGIITIRVPDLDTALAWAARCPFGSGVEVRPNIPLGPEMSGP